MEYQYLLSIKGSKQGQLKAPGAKGGRIDKWLECLSFEMGSMAPLKQSPSGGPQERRKHKPIVITRETDSASPLLYQMCVTNESITEVLILVKSQGHTLKSILLHDAAIAKVGPATQIPDGRLATAGKPFTRLEINFQQIQIENLGGGKTAADDWNAQT